MYEKRNILQKDFETSPQKPCPNGGRMQRAYCNDAPPLISAMRREGGTISAAAVDFSAAAVDFSAAAVVFSAAAVVFSVGAVDFSVGAVDCLFPAHHTTKASTQRIAITDDVPHRGFLFVGAEAVRNDASCIYTL